MAEAILRNMRPDDFVVYSSGLAPLGMVPDETVEVLESHKLDTSVLFSKGLNNIPLGELDYMIVLDPYVSISERVVSIMRNYNGLEMITWDVSDPYAGAIANYKDTFDFLEVKIAEFLQEIKNR